MFDFYGWRSLNIGGGQRKRREGKHQKARVGDTFVLRMFDFGGPWSVTLKNRGWSKKTEWQTILKSKGGSLAAGTYLQRGSAPSARQGREPTKPNLPTRTTPTCADWASIIIGGNCCRVSHPATLFMGRDRCVPPTNL